MKIGILPLGRPTFDVTLAEAKLQSMLAVLNKTGNTVCGPAELLLDGEQTRCAIEDLKQQSIDRLLVLQVTFTDSLMTIEAANVFDCPLCIWAIPEPRLGDRLRLNSFCGLNLAGHALGLNHREFSWLYTDPEKTSPAMLEELFSGQGEASQAEAMLTDMNFSDLENPVVNRMKDKRIARIGERPAGFDTCDYEAGELSDLTGITVDELKLDELFEVARAADGTEVAKVRNQAEGDLQGLADVDQSELDKSLRLKVALDNIRNAGAYDAFAIRCWPETFTEYGGAICGPVSMLGEARIPCACEADVYGAASQLILQEVARAPVFLTDLVDVDIADNTGVVWHCGQAPLSMCDPNSAAEATIHTNRKMPLLYEFALKPGRVTFFRLSQAFGEPKMALSSGEMLQRPMAYTGTSGVVRFDSSAEQILDTVINAGLEHHMALVYGDWAEELRAVAAALKLPVLEL